MDPEIAEDVSPEQLDRTARQRLRTLTKDNSDRVAKHLIMAGRLIDDEPEVAYEHAHSALRRAGRVDIVREAVALTAYATARYAEALRELRTVRRLSGVDAHRAIEADCERGLGRPERAIALASASPSDGQSPDDRVELAIVVSGARLDMYESEAALLALESPLVASTRDPELRLRVDEARVTVLRALGRDEEASTLEATFPAEAAGTEEESGDDEVVMSDLEDEALPPGSDR